MHRRIQIRNLAWLVGVTVIVLGLAVGVFLEILYGLPIPGSVYVGFGVSCIVVLGALPRTTMYSRGRYVAIVLLTLCVLYFTPWNSRKVFLRALFRVRPGMDIDTVDHIMRDYVHLRTSYELGDEHFVVFRHRNNYADFGDVVFRDGAVIRVVFLPD